MFLSVKHLKSNLFQTNKSIIHNWYFSNLLDMSRYFKPLQQIFWIFFWYLSFRGYKHLPTSWKRYYFCDIIWFYFLLWPARVVINQSKQWGNINVCVKYVLDLLKIQIKIQFYFIYTVLPLKKPTAASYISRIFTFMYQKEGCCILILTSR